VGKVDTPGYSSDTAACPRRAFASKAQSHPIVAKECFVAVSRGAKNFAMVGKRTLPGSMTSHA
jgi:hypothetical protein